MVSSYDKGSSRALLVGVEVVAASLENSLAAFGIRRRTDKLYPQNPVREIPKETRNRPQVHQDTGATMSLQDANNNKNWKQPKQSISSRLNKPILVYSYIMKIYTAMNDTHKLNIELKKERAGKHIQYGFIYLGFQSRQRQTTYCLEIV